MKDVLLYVTLYITFIIGGIIAGYFLNAVTPRLEDKTPFLEALRASPHYEGKIEILTSLLFLINFYYFGLSIETLNGIILSCLLIVISIVDLHIRIIPNIIVLPFTTIGLIINTIKNFTQWWKPLSCSFGAFLFMLIIHLIYPKGMGMGDVKLGFMVGSYLVTNVIIALPLSFLILSIYGLFLIIGRKVKLKDAIPFAPFISLGSLIALFWGNYILKLYISF